MNSRSSQVLLYTADRGGRDPAAPASQLPPAAPGPSCGPSVEWAEHGQRSSTWVIHRVLPLTASVTAAEALPLLDLSFPLCKVQLCGPCCPPHSPGPSPEGASSLPGASRHSCGPGSQRGGHSVFRASAFLPTLCSPELSWPWLDCSLSALCGRVACAIVSLEGAIPRAGFRQGRLRAGGPRPRP